MPIMIKNSQSDTSVIVTYCRRQHGVFFVRVNSQQHHHDCAKDFLRIPEKDNDKLYSERSIQNDAFEKLCKFLDENDECQYSLSELSRKMDNFLVGAEGYSQKYLKHKLKEHYQDEISITNFKGLANICTFRDKTDEVLHANWKNEQRVNADTEKHLIIDMAASIIRDEIRTKAFDCTEYATIEDTNGGSSMIPDSLARLMSGIIKTKAKDENEKSKAKQINKRREIAISHSIIAACRPRSFVSPILLATAVYIHRKYASRELLDMLSALGFSDNYTEIQRLNYSFLCSGEPFYDLNGYLQFIFDNADFNSVTLTGHGTYHAMGGIACVTPGTKVKREVLKRRTKVPSTQEFGKFGSIPIKTYKHAGNLKIGLKSLTVKPLSEFKPKQLNITSLTSMDNLWMLSFIKTTHCSLWSGYMHSSVTGNGNEKSRIEILPFINLDPSNPSAIYTALSFARSLCDQYGYKACPVTFDQPLYIKAAEIVLASDDLTGVIVRLGGFHLLMSFLGCIGHIMGGSGLETLWATVYAKASVVHMTTGHAYARALRANFLTAAALTAFLIQQPENSNQIDDKILKRINEQQLESTLSRASKQEILKLNKVVTELKTEASETRTGKLWINYMGLVQIVQLFIRAERTGNWNLHLYCISRMIPFFHAAGHLAYAKSARLYFQDMQNIKSKMGPAEYKSFTERGYFTIRRTDKFWSGNFSDQTIEQNLMRLFKSSGGMTRGRGITDSTMSRWILSLPYCIPICDAIENFTGVHPQSSEQHKDLRLSSETRDKRDFETLLLWLKSHSPFTFNVEGIVSISTGIVADEKVNCDRAEEIGKASAASVIGVNFSEIKLKRNDKVVTINTAINSVNVRGRLVEVNPQLLFNRITCVIQNKAEMKLYLTYELSQHPPSLFDHGVMRKTAKSVLGDLLKSEVEVVTRVPKGSVHVIDGGYLLRVLVWPSDVTYGQICNLYAKLTLDRFGEKAIVVFDGYEDTMTTKSAERHRRALKGVSRDILFDEQTKVVTTQSSFLANSSNKTRLIHMIEGYLTKKGIKTYQADADADRLIVSTALTESASPEKPPVVVVGTDTDLLVMLVTLVSKEQNIYMMTRLNETTLYNINAIKVAIGRCCKYLLIFHAITGCDTVSAVFGKGKKRAYQLLKGEKSLKFLDPFLEEDSDKPAIEKAGEKLLLQIYGAKNIGSLDRYRFIAYNRMVCRSKLSQTFKLESLPPTKAAAKYHFYRTFLTTQEWLGNNLAPTDWGWSCKDNNLLPIETDRPVAPKNLLRMVSCGCKADGCGDRCSCRRTGGLTCNAMCTNCMGQTCTNRSPSLNEESDGQSDENDE